MNKIIFELAGCDISFIAEAPEDITLKQSILISISQALAAAFPGVSRSGITMTIARALKIDRESAAKFSFLLATPIVAAAVLVDITEFVISIPFILFIFVYTYTSFLFFLSRS